MKNENKEVKIGVCKRAKTAPIAPTLTGICLCAVHIL